MIGQHLRRLFAALFIVSVAMAASPAVAGKTKALLAASWQPAFCEGHGGVPECRTATEDRFDSHHFSLHGLWPLKAQYCGVDAETRRLDQSGDWHALPALALKPRTREALETVMPGTRSGLHRHEWYKHGTCTGLSADAYFTRSIELLEALNGSEVAVLFDAHIGRYLSESAVSAAFVAAFGHNAERRVKMKCVQDGERSLIAELTIGLSADYASGPALAQLIAGAGTTSFGCDGGIVDPAGHQ